jgi:hypothetical protein
MRHEDLEAVRESLRWPPSLLKIDYVIQKAMRTTRWTKLISVRVDLDLLELMKKEVEDRRERGNRRITLSSLINDIIHGYYFRT